MTTIAVVVVGTIGAGRLLWLLVYFGLWWRAVSNVSPLRDRVKTAVRQAGRTPTVRLIPHLEDPAESHRRLLERAARRLDLIFAGGAIALAAWTQLFASSESPPASELSTTTLGLLLLGAAVLLTIPLLFRVDGSHWSYIGRETTIALGYGAVAVSLLSAVPDVYGAAWTPVVASLAIGIGARDLAEVWAETRLLGSLKFAYEVSPGP